MLRPDSLKTVSTGGRVSKYLLAQQHRFQVFELREDGSSVTHEFNRNELLELAKQDANIVFPGADGTQPTARSRDIRLLNPEFHSNNSIVVRMLCVICSLDPIHALVLPDRLFVVLPSGADEFLMRMKLKMRELTEDHGMRRSLESLRLSSRRARQASIGSASSRRTSRENDVNSGNHLLASPSDVVHQKKREGRKRTLTGEHSSSPRRVPINSHSRPAQSLSSSSSSSEKNLRKEEGSLHDKASILDRLHLSQPHHHHHPVNKKHSEEGTPENVEEDDDDHELFHNVPAPDSDVVMAAASALRSQSSGSSFDEEHDSLSFELRALESILFACVEMISEEVAKVKPRVLEIETSVDADVNTVRLENIRRTKHAIDSVLARANGLSAAINDTLLDDRSMALMSFSRILADPATYSTANDENEHEWSADHVEVEMLLESYLQHIDALIAEAEVAKTGLESAESNFLLRLDNARNKLLSVRVSIYTVTSVCSFGTFFTALFAMNLNSGIQTEPYWFWSITGVLCIGSVVFIMSFLSYIARRGYLLV